MDRCPTGYRGRHMWAAYLDHDRRCCLSCGVVESNGQASETATAGRQSPVIPPEKTGS